MTTNDHIEIFFNKKRLISLLIACSFCFLLGFLLVVYPPPLNFHFLIIPINKTFLGVALMAFFGYFIFNSIRTITGNKPALIIDSKGITDNSTWASAGQILWTDIQEIKIVNANNQQFIVAIVKNPEEYMSRQSGLKRKIVQNYYKGHGSPIMIHINGLNCTLNELFQVLQHKYKEATQFEFNTN